MNECLPNTDGRTPTLHLCEIAALQHKVLDDTMEFAILVSGWHILDTVLAGAQLSGTREKGGRSEASETFESFG
jgi:hypothetical protein